MRTELVLPLPRGDLNDLLHLHQKGQRPAKGPVSEHHSQAGPACLSGILAQGTAVAMHDTAFGCWEPSSDRQALPPRASVLVDKDRRDRQSASWSTGADSCHVAQGPQVPPPIPLAPRVQLQRAQEGRHRAAGTGIGDDACKPGRGGPGSSMAEVDGCLLRGSTQTWGQSCCSSGHPLARGGKCKQPLYMTYSGDLTPPRAPSVPCVLHPLPASNPSSRRGQLVSHRGWMGCEGGVQGAGLKGRGSRGRAQGGAAPGQTPSPRVSPVPGRHGTRY